MPAAMPKKGLRLASVCVLTLGVQYADCFWCLDLVSGVYRPRSLYLRVFELGREKREKKTHTHRS